VSDGPTVQKVSLHRPIELHYYSVGLLDRTLWLGSYRAETMWKVSRVYSQLNLQLIKVVFNLAYKFRVMVFNQGVSST